MMNEHTAKAFDSDLQELTRKVAEMGGLAEREIADAIQALTQRDTDLAQRVIAADPTIDALQQRDRGEGRSSPSRGASRWRCDLREIVARAARRPTIWSASATSPRTSPSASSRSRATSSRHKLLRGVEHMADLVLAPAQGTCSTPTPAAISPSALAVWKRRRGDRRAVHLAVPRAADLHDGRPAQHHASAPICCSAPRTSSAWATTPPTSPRPSITWSRARRSPSSGRRATPRRSPQRAAP